MFNGSSLNKKEKEKQRYGRNKDTSINRAYINGGEYRNKFDAISDNDELNRTVYRIAKKMLEHRSGTLYEDMYWIDIDAGRVFAFEITPQTEREVLYSRATRRKIRKHKNILVLHTHPNSMPPSISDLNSAYKNGYQIGLVCCHNGRVFMYNSNVHIFELFYKSVVAKYKKMGYDEFEAQVMTLNEYKASGKISFKEL